MTNPAYLAQLYSLALGVECRVPTILWGGPGTGKTTIIEQMARQSGRHCETVIASIRGPEEFGGIPVVNHKTGTTSLAPPSWGKRIVEHGGGIVFLDEITTAMPSVQATLLRPVLENTVGDLILPDETCWLAAANPPEQAADGYDLAGPLANRFFHIKWQMFADVLSEGLLLGWPEVPSVTYDREAYPVAHAEVSAKVSTFIGKIKPELHNVVPKTDDAAGLAWPSNRSWTQMIHLLAALDSSDIPAEYRETVRNTIAFGSIGEEAGLQYLRWEKMMDLPDPEDLIADPMGWEVPLEIDKVYAISGSVLAAFTRKPTPERWIATGDVYGRIAEAGFMDIAFMAGRTWARTRPEEGAPMCSNYAMDQLLPILSELEQHLTPKKSVSI